MSRDLSQRPTRPRGAWWTLMCVALGHKRRQTGWVLADCYCARCDRILIRRRPA
jgi:hypothetical protein